MAVGQPYGESGKQPGQLVLNGAETIRGKLSAEPWNPDGGAQSRLTGAQDR
jgi:hypothetical protein